MAQKNYKLGMIGTEEAIGGFQALGVHCFDMQRDEDIEQVIKTVQEEKDFAVLFITEDWAERVRDRLDEVFEKAALPAIVTVPSQKGASEAGLKNLRTIVEKAVGSDILFNN